MVNGSAHGRCCIEQGQDGWARSCRGVELERAVLSGQRAGALQTHGLRNWLEQKRKPPETGQTFPPPAPEALHQPPSSDPTCRAAGRSLQTPGVGTPTGWPGRRDTCGLCMRGPLSPVHHDFVFLVPRAWRPVVGDGVRIRGWSSTEHLAVAGGRAAPSPHHRLLSRSHCFRGRRYVSHCEHSSMGLLRASQKTEKALQPTPQTQVPQHRGPGPPGDTEGRGPRRRLQPGAWGGQQGHEAAPASQLPGPQRGSPQRPRLLVPVVPPSPHGAPRSVASSSSQQMNQAEPGIWPGPRKCWPSTGQQCPPVAAAISTTTVCPSSGWTLGHRHRHTPADLHEPQRRAVWTLVHVSVICPGSAGVTAVSQLRRTWPWCPGSTREGHRAQPR